MKLRVVLCVLGVVLGVRAVAHAQTQAEDGPTPDARMRESVRGPVSVRVRLEPDAPRIGDTLTLEIEAVAEPGVELLMPAFGDALGRFQIVDFVPSEEVDAAGRTRSRQTYRLQTRRSGPQQVPPLVVEFVDRRPGEREAPEGTDAYEILTEALTFQVESGLASGEPLELRGAKGALGPLGTGRWVALLLGALAAGAVAAGVGWRMWSAGRGRLHERSAFERARAELDALLARGRPSQDGMDPFFVELSAIVRRYLEARFRLRSPELTTEEFFEVMSDSPDLGPSHQQLLQDFLRRADLVKFAHHVPDEGGVDASIEAVKRFLEETRERAEEPALRPVAAHG